jgi:hypothetical protein
MGATTRTSITEIGGILISASGIDGTGYANVTANSSGTIYMLDIDNTKNTTDVYFKIKDHGSNVGAGQTPDWMFKGKAGVVTSYVFNTGLAYAAGVSIWCTQMATVANNTAPTNAVRIDMIAS